jgi:hypothetical protein
MTSNPPEQGDDQPDNETSTSFSDASLPPDDLITSEESGGADHDRDYILIYEGTSLTDFSQMDQVHSPEAKLARGRGGGEFPLLDSSPRSRSRSDDDSYFTRISRGKIKVERGFVMRFVDPELRHLSVFDICSIPEEQSFPVPESALRSLPPGLRGILEEQGYLQIQGEYDSTTQEFVDVMLGWEKDLDDPLDELMRIVKELDGRLAPAISYMVNKHGPEQWADPGVIAQARGIEESTVREQIEMAKQDLPDRIAQLDSDPHE